MTSRETSAASMREAVGGRASEAQSAASLQLELQRNTEAPARARAAVRGWCERREGPPDGRDTLLLLVSELVTNAVLHSPAAPEAPIRFSAKRTEECVQVAVTDGGEGFVPSERERTSAGGFGLYLLEQETSRWGVDRVGGTRVWFELETGRQRCCLS